MADVYGPTLPVVNKYYVLVPGSGTGTQIVKVNTPKKNSNGRYNVTVDSSFTPIKDMIKPLRYSGGKIYNIQLQSSTASIMLGAAATALTPVGTYRISSSDFVRKFNTGYDYCISITMSPGDLVNFLKTAGVSVGKKPDYAELMKTFSNRFFDKRTVSYIHKGDGASLEVYKHSPGNVTVTMTHMTQWKVNRRSAKSQIITVNISSIKSTSLPESVSISGKSFGMGDDTTIKFELQFNTIYTLAAGGTWEIGSIPDANKGNGWNTTDYCFYCSDNFDIEYLNYFTSNLPCYQSINKNKVHKQRTHSSSTSEKTNKDKGSTSQTPVKDVTYDSTPNTKTGAVAKSNAKAVSFTDGAKVGEYADSVALCPMLVIQLLGSDSENAPSYNITIPYTSTFVSLTHQRSLHDGYNKFTLQLFDQDAMQVEAKLLLGFRYVKFYYTDQTSRSKTFQGAIMDYKNVITGKGLMLNIEGYTTSTNIYTEKDSVPWSKLFTLKDYAFFYWLNKEEEYQGEVYMVNNDGSAASWNSYLSSSVKYNSTTGNMIPATQVKNTNPSMYDWMLDGKSCEYSLQVQNDNKLEWETYDEFYSSVDESIRAKYKPHPKVWSLEGYNEWIENITRDIFGTDDMTVQFENRPSNVVKMICAIMKWKTKEGYIVTTKEVSQIPDQTSKSFVQYILEDLVPISVSKYKNATQYDFWFDDEGYAHFAPHQIDESRKALYFNAPNKKDSYPLISFTSAVNGSVLMNANGQQTVEALNYFTGEELDYSGVKLAKGESDVPTTIYKSEEWYETSSIVGKNKQVTYTNTSTVPSEDELKSLLVYKYGTISQYTYKASLETWGAFDLEAGQSVDIYIYLDEGRRSGNTVYSPELKQTSDYNPEDHSTFTYVAPEDRKDYCEAEVVYKGNITLHHSSGTYFINKITDTISGGRFITQLECIKINSDKIQSVFTEVDEVYEIQQEKAKQQEDFENVVKWAEEHFDVINN